MLFLGINTTAIRISECLPRSLVPRRRLVTAELAKQRDTPIVAQRSPYLGPESTEDSLTFQWLAISDMITSDKKILAVFVFPYGNFSAASNNLVFYTKCRDSVSRNKGGV